MTARPGPTAELVESARRLPIDPSYIRQVIEDLTAIGSSPLGFRNTGTPEDMQVAVFVSEQLRSFGLAGVAIENVAVDAWRFAGAGVRVTGSGAAWEGCSLGGAPPTPAGGITAPVVDVGDPTRSRLDRLDLRGAIALADWRRKSVGPSAFVLELARRGAVGLILNCPAGGAYFQSDEALGCFDGHWPRDAPPMVMLRKEDAAELRAAARKSELVVTMTVDVDIEKDAAGHNVVGYLEGDEPGPIVVGAHHDAWFRGAFDNTSGVAALLALAKALAETGHQPRHTMCFTSRTAEEYGIVDSLQDWCIGAWRQVDHTHPDWAQGSPFHLCLEASGHPSLRTIVEAPVELKSWARRMCRAAEAEGWTPTGWRVWPPVAGTEQWPYLVKGIPGVAAYAWEVSFADGDYHTQLDTLDMIDTDIVAAQTRLYALLLLGADRDPDAILDHGARARELAKIAETHQHTGLAQAAERHRSARGRRAFTDVGRGLIAVDADVSLSYPHGQCFKDLRALDAAIAALDDDRPADAARAIAKVGEHGYFPYLSQEAFAAHDERLRPEAAGRSWGSASHLTRSPNLWSELATLKSEAGSRPLGPWVRAALVRARKRVDREQRRRLDAMAASLSASNATKGELP